MSNIQDFTRRPEIAKDLRRLLAGGMVAVAILVNKWTLEALVVTDGAIESPVILTAIVAFQVLVAATGIIVWRSDAPWADNFTLLVLSALITGAATELFFRVAIPPAYPARRVDSWVVTPIPDHPGDSARAERSTYASNPRGYFDDGNIIDHHLNSGGWHDVEHELEKPKGTFRVVGLGDSYLFGRGVRYEDNVLTQLGRMLEDSLSLRVDAINFGRPGSNTQDQLQVLESVAAEYEPDLVILFYVLNDVEVDLMGPGPRMEFWTYPQPDLLSRFSRSWGWIRARFLSAYVARRYIRMAVSTFVGDQSGWELNKQALLDIQSRTDAIGAELLLVIFPFYYQLQSTYPFQIVHDIVSGFAQHHAIEVLDLRDAYPGFDGPELWVHETDQHPNEKAHALTAAAVFQYLRAHPHLIERAQPAMSRPSMP